MLKRLLFISYEYPPLGGGVATAAHHLLQKLSQDFRIDVVTSSLDNTWSQTKLSPNLNLYRVPIGNRAKDKFQSQSPWQMMRFTWASWRQVAWLLRQAAQDNDSYSLAHYFGYPGALPGLFFKPGWRLFSGGHPPLPYLASLRGVDVPGYNPRFSLFYLLYKPLCRLAWSQAKAVVANSFWLRALAAKTWPRKIEVVFNGVDTKKFRPVLEKNKFRTFTVTAGGTILNNKKGLEVLLRGFASFHKDYHRSKLLLFGEGDQKKQLEALSLKLGIEQAAVFVGRVSHEDLAKQLPRCHVLCLPSRVEGMSNALLEGMASGLAIVATPVGGVMEALRYEWGEERLGDVGEIVEIGDHEAIAEVLTKLYRDDSYRQGLGQRARQKSLQLSWEKAAARYKEIYD